MVLDARFPTDLRVEKELTALASEYDVYIMCASDSPPSYSGPGFQLSSGPKSTKLSKGIRDLFLGLFNFDPIMFIKVSRMIKKIQPCAIHVHDLPQFNTIFKANKKNAQLILDMHENYPEATEIWFNWRKSKIIRLKNKLFNKFSRWKKFEQRACINADYVIAVVEEMKTKIITDHSINAEKIHVISNTESIQFARSFQNSSIQKVDEILTPNTFNLLYIGGIGPHRGLDDAIVGLGIFISKFSNNSVALHIVGGGNYDNIAHLQALVVKMNLERHVHFHKPIDFKLVSAVMQAADLNIIPHKSNGHCDNTIPHKLFQTMMSGSPVMVSSSPPLSRTIQSIDGGFVFKADDPNDFAEVLNQVIIQPEKRKEKATKAKAATISGTLNWEATSVDLKMLYRRILDQCTI